MPPAAPIQTLLTHLLATTAAGIGSHRILQRYAAVQSLIPPAAEVGGDNVPQKESTVKAAAPRTRRQTILLWCGIIGCTIALMAANVALVFASFRYASRNLQDAVWGVIFIVAEGLGFARVLPLVWGSDETVRIERVRGELRKVYQGSSQPPYYVRCTLGMLLAGGGLAGALLGHPVVLAVFPAVEVFLRIAQGFLPTTSIQHVVLGMASYIIICSICIGIGHTPTRSKDHPIVLPSPTMQAAIGVFLQCIPIMLPGFLASLCLRFDWSRRPRSIALSTLEPGQSVPVEAPLEAFSKPTYRAVIFSCVLTSLGLSVASFLSPTPEQVAKGARPLLSPTDIEGVALSLPLCVAFAAAAAWRHGRLRDWWTYKERSSIDEEPRLETEKVVA